MLYYLTMEVDNMKRKCDCGKLFEAQPDKDVASLGVSFSFEMDCPECRKKINGGMKR